jgi:RNA polymerase sigma factor (sigma-70 family)
MDVHTDPGDFEQLVRVHTSALRRFCHHLAGPSDGDDLLQETLARALVNFGSLRDQERFLPWCRQIARNAHIRCLRSAKATEPLVELPARGDLEGEVVEDLVRRAELARVLAAMPERSRAVLAARAEGVAPEALAASYGVSRTLVDTWFARSKIQARNLLEELRAAGGVGAVGVLVSRTRRRGLIAVLAVGVGVTTLVLVLPHAQRTAPPAVAAPAIPVAVAIVTRSRPPTPVTAVVRHQRSAPRPPVVRSVAASTTRTSGYAIIAQSARIQPILIDLPSIHVAIGLDPCWLVVRLLGSCPQPIAGLTLRI